MLIMRGARINVMNRGDDTPLHLAASHGHRDIVAKVHTHTHSQTGSWTCWCMHCLHLILALLYNFFFSLSPASWFNAKLTPIQSTSTGTQHSTMPASGARMKWQRYSTINPLTLHFFWHNLLAGNALFWGETATKNLFHIAVGLWSLPLSLPPIPRSLLEL